MREVSLMTVHIGWIGSMCMPRWFGGDRSVGKRQIADDRVAAAQLTVNPDAVSAVPPPRIDQVRPKEIGAAGIVEETP
ncbi:hypothetical protein [Rhodopila sp.]|uniref:hypothetical protein n=1 Tax=Rhodopila sp. TaxID=2480087 RepID=UPI003D0BA538